MTCTDKEICIAILINGRTGWEDEMFKKVPKEEVIFRILKTNFQNKNFR